MAKDCSGNDLAPGDAVDVPCVVERIDGDKVFLRTVGAAPDGLEVSIALSACCVEKADACEDDAAPYEPLVEEDDNRGDPR